MESWKQELANFLKLLGGVLVAGLGARVLSTVVPRAATLGDSSPSAWFWLPKVCGTILVLCGTLVVLYYLLERPLRSIRINVRTGAEKIPAPPPEPEQTETKSRKKK
jgi:hypothetical protein